MLRKIYQAAKRNRLSSNLLQCCDVMIKRQLPTHRYPLYCRVISNHWVNEAYEREIRETLQRLASQFSARVFYDIGANVGIFSLDFLSLNETNHVIAFEPNPLVFSCLERTKEKNRLEHLEIYQMALSDREAAAPLTFDPLSPAKGGLHPIFSGKYTHELDYNGISKSVLVKTTRLDSFGQRLRPPEIIKMDAEGEELAILKGAKKTCATYKPILLFECSKDHQLIYSLLKEYGYAIYNLDLKQTDQLGGMNIAIHRFC